MKRQQPELFLLSEDQMQKKREQEAAYLKVHEVVLLFPGGVYFFLQAEYKILQQWLRDNMLADYQVICQTVVFSLSLEHMSRTAI